MFYGIEECSGFTGGLLVRLRPPMIMFYLGLTQLRSCGPIRFCFVFLFDILCIFAISLKKFVISQNSKFGSNHRSVMMNCGLVGILKLGSELGGAPSKSSIFVIESLALKGLSIFEFGDYGCK